MPITQILLTEELVLPGYAQFARRKLFDWVAMGYGRKINNVNRAKNYSFTNLLLYGYLQMVVKTYN